VLHVANGDHALSVLREAGLPGEVVAWSDALDQGPLHGAPCTEPFRELRALWLADAGAGEVDEIRSQLEAWDRALLAPADEKVLWFERDLNCQLALLHHLAVLDGAVSVVVTDTPVPHQKDFSTWLRERRRFDRAQALRAWEAVTADDPRAVEALDLSGLPDALGPALRRLLEELPEPGSGLSRTERAILEEDAGFPRVQAREDVPWITDFMFARLVTELYDAGVCDEPARSECLSGRLDYRTRAPDRWVGGVLLSGPRCFRWDGQRVVAPSK
jgi:hypothetical protein